MKYRKEIGLSFFLCLCLVSCRKDKPPVQAHVRTSLLAETTSIRPGEPFWVMLQLQMDTGWHTYWKDPGDSGMATEVKWKLPERFKAGDLFWPAPEKFTDSAGTTYGYTGRVGLLAKITPSLHVRDGDQVSLGAEVRWLECSDACLPGKSLLSLELPVKDSVPAPDLAVASLFSEVRSRIPKRDFKIRRGGVKK